ncbi:MAG: hypothetical protein AABX17_03730 [Nanoarchaeota archaeon]
MNLTARYEETLKRNFLLVRGKFSIEFFREFLAKPSPYLFEAIDSDPRKLIPEGYVRYEVNSPERAQAL